MQLDMNLLAALDVLLDEGSVGGAADRLHLSQPAMSRTLARLRRATGDEILVRSGRGMVPTPYAVAVRDEVHALAAQVLSVLSPDRELDLAALEATFTLRFHDAITNAAAAAIIARVRTEAPGVRLRFLAETSAEADGLRTGRTDLEITSEGPALADVESRLIGNGRLIVVLRPQHPLASIPMTVRRFATAEHVTVSRRGRLTDPIDDALSEMGLARIVVATAPTSSAALHVARETDVLVAVPERVCDVDIAALGLVTAPMPFELPPVPIVLSWHQRHNGDSAHRWLRTLVRDQLTAIAG